MEKLTIKVQDRFEPAGYVELEAEVVFGDRIYLSVLAKAPTGNKTYKASCWLGNVSEHDDDKVYRAPRTATVRNRNWPVVALGAEAANNYNNNY